MDKMNNLLRSHQWVIGNDYIMNKLKKISLNDKHIIELNEPIFEHDFIILAPENKYGYYNMIEIKKEKSSFMYIIKHLKAFYQVQNKMGDHKFLESFNKVKFNDNIYVMSFGS